MRKGKDVLEMRARRFDDGCNETDEVALGEGDDLFGFVIETVEIPEGRCHVLERVDVE